MQPFTYTGRPARVMFGAGTLAALPEELARLGRSRALVLAGTGFDEQAHRLAAGLGARAVAVFARARMHTPVATTERALEELRRCGADVLVALGGGSAIGLGKAIALRTDLPQIAIPVSYAGSEMTPILGETEDGQKRTQTTDKVLPEVVIYDVELTLRLPVPISVASGLNAIAHAVEALYARERNPVITLLAESGIAALASALPRIVANSHDREARSDALYGAWLCGICLGSVGMALHHKLCHTLGGLFDLPHAPMHAAILPHALAYNAPAVPQETARLAHALGASDAATALFDLAKGLGAEMALANLGMPRDGIERAVKEALAHPYWNPHPIEGDGLRALLRNALDGKRPHAAHA